MIRVVANARSAALASDDIITSGSVGIPVVFELSEDFEGLACTAVFQGSEVARDVALIDGAACEVPAECLAEAGGVLRIGIYASNAGGTVVIPTVWASSRVIEAGTEPSEYDPAGPSPSWSAQVQAAAAEALREAGEAKSAAITAQNSAGASAEAARTAQQGAETAQQGAKNAQSRAETAQSGAETARSEAETARSAAQTAQQGAENAQQGAEAAQGKAEGAAASIKADIKHRVASLTDVGLAVGNVAEVEGVPAYLAAADLEGYTEYGITEPGWYAFSRISAPEGVTVTEDTAVEGAAGAIIEAGADHVDVAVRFGVTAMGVPVAVTWDADHADRVVYKATDLAVRNLDYRTTFYVYDIGPYASWQFGLTNNDTFVGTAYYVLENGAYVRVAVIANTPIPEDTYYVHSYALTTDETFVEGTTYYTVAGGVYTEAEVTPGEAVTANTYYVDVWTLTTDKTVKGTAYYTKDGDAYVAAAVIAGEPVPAYYVQGPIYALTTDAAFVDGTIYYTRDGDIYTVAEVTPGDPIPAGTYYVQVYAYALTEDETFASGTIYYTKDGSSYTEAEVITGEAIPANTYYVRVPTYVQATDAVFAKNVDYYTKDGDVYTAAEVTPGDPIPAYYVHSKVTFAGMVRNVTYRLDELIDCPIEIALPEVAEDGHGCWFEIQTHFDNTRSVTLLPPSEDVKAAKVQTQAMGKGINVLDLHYTNVDGLKAWTLMNTHSDLPT